MQNLNLLDVTEYVENNIENFHKARLNSLKKLQLIKVLKRKNPYLFKAKYFLTPTDIVRALLSAHISSNEETIFGDWLEGLAIYLNQKIYSGLKSPSDGIDLDFTRDNQRYIVSIKSGPNWGNSSQIKKMQLDFRNAIIRLRTSRSNTTAIPVNGCCYGNQNVDKGDYLKICGQKFWELITGDSELYLKIIEPLGHKAKETNEEYNQEYAKLETAFVLQFTKEFCKTDLSIDWDKIVKLNSEYKASRIKTKD